MSEKERSKKRGRRGGSKAFYFTHSKEVMELSESLKAKENQDFAGFCRAVFNAGLEAKYGIKLIDNKPILPDQAA